MISYFLTIPYAEGANDVRAIQVASNLLEPEKKATLNIKGDAVKIEAKSTAEGVKATALSVMSTGVVSIEGDAVIKADKAIVARGNAIIEMARVHEERHRDPHRNRQHREGRLQGASVARLPQGPRHARAPLQSRSTEVSGKQLSTKVESFIVTC